MIVKTLTPREAKDYSDIQNALGHRFDRGGMWFVVRRGRPGARIRVLYRGRQLAAMARFTSERQRMRQGMLALVDPAGRIDRYTTEPMVKQLLRDLGLRRPHGNVAHYWLRAGLSAAAHCLDQRASSLRHVAAGMTSEYDDPSLLSAQADALEDAAQSIRVLRTMVGKMTR